MYMVEEKTTIYIIKMCNGYKIFCSGFHKGEPMHAEFNEILSYHHAKILAKKFRRIFRNLGGGYMKTKVIDYLEADSLHFPAKELVSTEALPNL